MFIQRIIFTHISNHLTFGFRYFLAKNCCLWLLFFIFFKTRI